MSLRYRTFQDVASGLLLSGLDRRTAIGRGLPTHDVVGLVEFLMAPETRSQQTNLAANPPIEGERGHA